MLTEATSATRSPRHTTDRNDPVATYDFTWMRRELNRRPSQLIFFTFPRAFAMPTRMRARSLFNRISCCLPVATGSRAPHGLTLADVLIEEGVSGSVPVEERPIGGVLFAKLERGDIVIAAKLDRLFRSALDALKVVESLKGRGVKLHLLDLGGDIAGNGISKLFLTIAAAFAEAERDRIRERIGQAKADQKSRGRFLGGDVPFGFEVGADGALVPVEEQQAAIREIAALISHEGVARILKGRRAA